MLHGRRGILLLLLTAAAAQSCSGRSKPLECEIDRPMLGFAHGARYDMYIWQDLPFEERVALAAADVVELGGGWFRPHPSWKDTEPVVDRPGLTIEGITDQMVESYASGDPAIDWSKTDAVVDGFTDAGVCLCLVVNGGYENHLPDFVDPAGQTLLFTPDNAGRDLYLAAVSLHVRATVRRYRDRVRDWQIENELNVACETVRWGWRQGEDAWCDPEFLDRLMSTLADAVHAEDPTARRTHNFHTDFHWLEDVEEWEPLLEVIGIDAYPNYLYGEPVNGETVGERVGLTVDVANGKPIAVLESGYPTQPEDKDFSEQGQAAYIEQAIRTTFENGGSGFFYFTLVTNEQGGAGLADVEPYWGLFHRDGTRKLGWGAYREINREIMDNYGSP